MCVETVTIDKPFNEEDKLEQIIETVTEEENQPKVNRNSGLCEFFYNNDAFYII